jgi:hypothetical protein
MRVGEVAEPVFRVDVVVAGIDAPVVLDRDAFAAEFPVDADLRRQSEVLGDECLEVRALRN